MGLCGAFRADSKHGWHVLKANACIVTATCEESVDGTFYGAMAGKLDSSFEACASIAIGAVEESGWHLLRRVCMHCDRRPHRKWMAPFVAFETAMHAS